MLLTKEQQDKIVDLLIDYGLVDINAAKKVYAEVIESQQPILAALKAKGVATDDCIQHATAVVINSPYYDLRNLRFDKKSLLAIPQEIAQRSRVVPLNQKDGHLYVAVLDPSNIQRVDYVTTLVKMPVKVVMTSDAGIDNALMQYVADLKDVDRAAESEEKESGGMSEQLENLTRALTDLGCGETAVRQAEYLLEAGQTDALIRHLRLCRCGLMDAMHESQRRVDRMDYLIRQTEKTRAVK